MMNLCSFAHLSAIAYTSTMTQLTYILIMLLKTKSSKRILNYENIRAVQMWESQKLFLLLNGKHTKR